MKKDPVLEKLRETIAEQLGIRKSVVVLQAKFIDDLGASASALMKLATALEKRFKIKISKGDIGKLVTVQNAFDYIQQGPKERSGKKQTRPCYFAHYIRH